MSFFDNHFTPATIITPPGPTGVSNEIHTIHTMVDSDSDSDAPFTSDQEQSLLMKMNEEQGKTIEELQTRIKALEKELVEKPVPAICYINCSHCQEEKKADKK
jgi:hypothetical protein